MAPVLPDCWVSVAPLHPRVFPGLPLFPLHSRTVSRHWGSVGDGCRCSRAGFVICPVLSLSLGVSIRIPVCPFKGIGRGPGLSGQGVLGFPAFFRRLPLRCKVLFHSV